MVLTKIAIEGRHKTRSSKTTKAKSNKAAAIRREARLLEAEGLSIRIKHTIQLGMYLFDGDRFSQIPRLIDRESLGFS